MSQLIKSYDFYMSGTPKYKVKQHRKVESLVRLLAFSNYKPTISIALAHTSPSDVEMVCNSYTNL